MVAVEIMLCDAMNRLFGNGQPGELERIRTEAKSLGDRITKIESFREQGVAVSKEKKSEQAGRRSEQARFYTRVGLVVAIMELFTHSAGWAKEILASVIAAGKH